MRITRTYHREYTITEIANDGPVCASHTTDSESELAADRAVAMDGDGE